MTAACRKSFQVRKGGGKNDTVEVGTTVDDGAHHHEEENKRHEMTISAHHRVRESEGGQETTVSAGEKEIRSRA
jgi:hypothetical protein